MAMHPLDLALIAGGGLLGLLALVASALAWRSESSLLAIRETPTSTVADAIERHRWAIHGLTRSGHCVEIVGTIECDSPLRAPYSEQPCVAYAYSVNEEAERRVGGYGARRGHELETSSFDAHDRRVPRFYLRDDTGRIAVDTAGATFDLRESVARYEAYTGIWGSEREIWREERVLPLGERAYVLGYLVDGGGEPVIARHPRAPGRRFLISYRDERSLAAAIRRRAYMLYLAGGLSLGGSLVLLVAAALF
ncbi:MAG: hypothetical protein OHK0015_33270 [Chloroflexi bacterium OHK40]